MQNWLRQFSAASTTNLVPARMCQIGPKSVVTRLRSAVATSCSSLVSKLATSWQTASMILASDSQPGQFGKTTRTSFSFETSGLTFSASVPFWSRGSNPGDFHMITTQPSRDPNFHTPIALWRTLQAYPKALPTATCQCSPKFRSKAAFKIFANCLHRSSFVRSLSWLNSTWRL